MDLSDSDQLPHTIPADDKLNDYKEKQHRSNNLGDLK